MAMITHWFTFTHLSRDRYCFSFIVKLCYNRMVIHLQTVTQSVTIRMAIPLQWRHNRRDDVWNHQHHDCLLDLIFRRRSKKTSKLRVTNLCAGNSPVTGEFPAQMGVTRKMFPFDDVIIHLLTGTQCVIIRMMIHWRIYIGKSNSLCISTVIAIARYITKIYVYVQSWMGDTCVHWNSYAELYICR